MIVRGVKTGKELAFQFLMHAQLSSMPAFSLFTLAAIYTPILAEEHANNGIEWLVSSVIQLHVLDNLTTEQKLSDEGYNKAFILPRMHSKL